MQVRQAATIGRWSFLLPLLSLRFFCHELFTLCFSAAHSADGQTLSRCVAHPLYAVSPSDDGKNGICEAFMSYPFPCAKLLKEIHRRQDCGYFFHIKEQTSNPPVCKRGFTALQTRFPNNTDKASPQPEEALSAFLYISHSVSIYFPFEMQSFPFAATPTAKPLSPPP